MVICQLIENTKYLSFVLPTFKRHQWRDFCKECRSWARTLFHSVPFCSIPFLSIMFHSLSFLFLSFKSTPVLLILFNSIAFHAILCSFHSILFYEIQFQDNPCCSMRFLHSMLLYEVPFPSMPFNAILWGFISFHSIPFHSIPLNSIKFHSTPFPAILWYFICNQIYPVLLACFQLREKKNPQNIKPVIPWAVFH